MRTLQPCSLALLTLLTACTSAPAAPASDLAVVAPPALVDTLGAHLATIDTDFTVVVRGAADPRAARATRELAVVLDETGCTDCFRIEVDATGPVIHADAILGAEYGIAHALEQAGLRFFHPDRSYIPAAGAELTRVQATARITPERTVRGLHVHTLHPIEGLFDLWEPGEESEAGAKRILDWVARNRGNLVTYAALDDITAAGARRDAWRAHTQRIVAHAHAIGVKVGLGIQVFGASNLQSAFDLSDGRTLEPAVVEERLAVLDGLGFDVVKLSFGEFFGTDPQTFVDGVGMTVGMLRQRLPGVEVVASVHVGDSPDQRVTYRGEEQLYYFLVRYADPAPTPWIHTVMYYDLYNDAGGAYHHESFAEHRAFLQQRLRDRQPVAYYPENAYWVSFDINVPTYLPLYAKARVFDLERLRADAQAGGYPDLQQHVVFSSGWEWGYWQNDVIALRATHTQPSSVGASFEELFAPFGDAGHRTALAINAAADAQHEALIVQRLAPWVAGRDALVEGGAETGIVSQPERPGFDSVFVLDAAGKTAFRANVVDRLVTLSTALDRAAADVDPAVSPWLAETHDGLAITALRARFVSELLDATLSSDPTAALARADATLAEATTIAARRHAALLSHRASDITAARRGNATLYDYGYLREAVSLCFWKRERTQVLNLRAATPAIPATCVL